MTDFLKALEKARREGENKNLEALKKRAQTTKPNNG